MAEPRTSPEPPPPLDHNIVATYADPGQARHAIEALERAGVEAGNISILGDGTEPTAEPETNVEQRETDLAVTGTVGKRAFGGLLMGAIIGALIGGGGGYLLHELAGIGPNAITVALAGAVSFGAIGAYAGGWYGGASALPVSDAWGETFESLRGGQACVAVRSHEADQAERAAEALASTEAIRVVRFGKDGQQTQIA